MRQKRAGGKERRGCHAHGGRFAPSPSGRMHLGNLLCSLLVWLSAKRENGRVVLRIEDLTPPAAPVPLPDFLRRIFLAGPDLGRGRHRRAKRSLLPKRAGGFTRRITKSWRKRAHLPLFLQPQPAACRQRPHREDGTPVYPGTCRGLGPERQAVLAQNARPPCGWPCRTGPWRLRTGTWAFIANG